MGMILCNLTILRNLRCVVCPYSIPHWSPNPDCFDLESVRILGGLHVYRPVSGREHRAAPVPT